MLCLHPHRGWRSTNGDVRFGGKPTEADVPIDINCGACLNCRKRDARAWALRCQLELTQHDSATFTTLTYDDLHLPPTLRKRDLQLFLKRLRKRLPSDRRAARRSPPTRPLRFFACGEYGETTSRPHYHAILYSTSDGDGHSIQEAWGLGHTHTVAVTPAAICYVAGYTNKKTDYRDKPHERVDPTTGEVYRYQPPFRQMSQGIAKHAKQYTDAWKDYAIYNGVKISTPRYLHQAWKDAATPQQLEQHKYEKILQHEILLADTTELQRQQQRDAAYLIARAQQRLAQQKRSYE